MSYPGLHFWQNSGELSSWNVPGLQRHWVSMVLVHGAVISLSEDKGCCCGDSFGSFTCPSPFFTTQAPSRPAALSFCSNRCEAPVPSGQGCVKKARTRYYVRIGRKYLLAYRMIKKDVV